MGNNRAIKMLERVNKAIKWRNIEALLLEYYDIGKSKEGADVYPIEFGDYSIGAYPPLMLLKCMLLQKCLRPGGHSPEWVSYSVGS